MKKILFLASMLLSGSAFALTDHYVLSDGKHVQHLKINTIGKQTTVYADVDFEPADSGETQHACTADISGEAKYVSENELVLKKQIPSERHFCTLTIKLSPTGAKIEQSEECNYFAAGLCHFNTEGKELPKVKQ